VRQDGVAQAPIMQMYSPFAQNPWGFFSFFALVDGDPAQLSAVVQRVVSKVDPMRPARDVLTTRAIVRGSTERQRAVTWMLIALAATALLMATIGLYGVSATAAAARSRELAIRAAVGAHPAARLRLIVQQGLFTCTVGVVLGAATSLAATRGLGAFLYETEPRDPATFAATAGLLLAVAAMATYLPARRALTANPAEVLRSE
jgi:putative ABC transport system permease protein